MGKSVTVWFGSVQIRDEVERGLNMQDISSLVPRMKVLSAEVVCIKCLNKVFELEEQLSCARTQIYK